MEILRQPTEPNILALLVGKNETECIRKESSNYRNRDCCYIAAMHVLLSKLGLWEECNIGILRKGDKIDRSKICIFHISSADLTYDGQRSGVQLFKQIDQCLTDERKPLDETHWEQDGKGVCLMLFSQDSQEPDSHDIIRLAEQFATNLILHIYENPNCLKLKFYFFRERFGFEYSEAAANGYRYLLQQLALKPEKLLGNLEVVPDKLCKHIQNDFCQGKNAYIGEESISQIFHHVVEKYKDKVAVGECADLHMLEERIVNSSFPQKDYESCCFEKNQYIISKPLKINCEYYIVKSPDNNILLINNVCAWLLEIFKAGYPLGEILRDLTLRSQIVIAEIHPEEPQMIQYPTGMEKDGITVSCLDELLLVIRILINNNLISLCGFKKPGIRKEVTIFNKKQPDFHYQSVEDMVCYQTIKKCDILLLGDKPGFGTVGLLYLASYLNRNGISAQCRIYDNNWNAETLKKNTIELLRATKPKYVGISMKWFPHIARCLEICRFIKEENPQIKTIIGGDTASVFHDKLIEEQNIDFIIRGDGEYPILMICRREATPVNCTWKKDGIVHKSAMQYHKDKSNEQEIYLSDLDRCLIDPLSLAFNPFYIHTHKICAMNCFYCGGRKEITEQTFQSGYTEWRDPVQVRNDINVVKDKVSVFMFEFGYKPRRLLEYCREIWEDFNLTDHYAAIYSISIPDEKLLKLASHTFRYVRWNLDICSLSETHRKKLKDKFSIKPLPSDQEILDFLQIAEAYPNIGIEINTIARLPLYDREDAISSEKFLEHIVIKYRNICQFTWGGYYQEPGTEAVINYRELGMVTGKNDYAMYKRLSYKNYVSQSYYPVLSDYNFPYIFYEDNRKNIWISEHCKKMDQIYRQARKSNRKRIVEYHTITYGQLDYDSDRLAAGIQRRYGKVPAVIIRVENKINLSVAIMAAIKCGIPYLPVDMEYPRKRLMDFSKVIDGALLLSDGWNSNDLEIRVFHENIHDLMTDDQEFNMIQTSPDDGIYYMLTSGTTGSAKGVLVRQKGIINYIRWRNKAYVMQENDITLQLLSESFDGFYSNFFSSVFAGGKLLFLRLGFRKDMRLASDVIHELGVTAMSLVPSIFDNMLEFAKSFTNLRFVVFGGEKVAPELLERLPEGAEKVKFINEYGMTESSITTSAVIGIVKSCPNKIGYPIDNTFLYIMNDDLNIMPCLVPGEIYVAGIGLTDGYIGQKELSHQKFMNNPYNKKERLYKTGDIGRLLPDGSFEFLKRKDSQMNLQGHRLEAGEIESLLKAHDKIKDAKVKQEGSKLIAHVFATQQLDIPKLKAELRNFMPEYMIPAQIYLEKEGDQCNCAELGNSAAFEQTASDIADLWEQVLETQDIDRNAHFFDIGGDSMSLLKIYAKLEKRYPGLVMLPDLFSYTTINELADYINEKLD